MKRQLAYLRDKRCLWCGSTENLTIDHIVPKSLWKLKFGTGDGGRKNYQVLCRKCNSKKGQEVISFRNDKGRFESMKVFKKHGGFEDLRNGEIKFYTNYLGRHWKYNII